VEFVRHLLVFLHLLGMAMLVGMFFVQRRLPEGAPLNVGWLHAAALQLVTGLALQLLAPYTDADYNQAKLGIKLVVLLVIGGLALTYVIRRVPAPRWLPFTLVGLVVVNVGLAVFWT
jgi:FtsH-binding integral membrane protein